MADLTTGIEPEIEATGYARINTHFASPRLRHRAGKGLAGSGAFEPTGDQYLEKPILKRFDTHY
jgi:hypothetical protein